MRILGIDPGLNITGYACVEIVPNRHDPQLVEGGVFRLKSGESIAYRLAQLHEDLSTVLDELKPQAMAVERLFSNYRHPRTPILMGHARGVVLLCAQLRAIELQELAATEVKKAMTGNGHASKHQMQQAVQSQLGLAQPPEPADVADAIGIALTAARRLAVV